MMAEGCQDSQKASSNETRKWRRSTGVPGNRQERGRNEEGLKGQGIQQSERRNENTGAGSLLEPRVGSDMNQGAGQRMEVGCHWSGSESREEADKGHSEAEDGNGWDTLGVLAVWTWLPSRQEGHGKLQRSAGVVDLETLLLRYQRD